MADPVLELQGAIIARLKSASPVVALVADRVADIPKPTWIEVPYISIGPSNYQNENVTCIRGGEVMIQLDCVSVSGSMLEVRRMAAAVRDALHEWEPVLASAAVVTFEHWRTDYIRDGALKQASIRYTATVEET